MEEKESYALEMGKEKAQAAQAQAEAKSGRAVILAGSSLFHRCNLLEQDFSFVLFKENVKLIEEPPSAQQNRKIH